MSLLPMLDLRNWTPRPRPSNRIAHGQHVSLAPFDPAVHGEQLWHALGGASANGRIRYFGWPPVKSASEFTAQLLRCIEAGEWACCVFTPKASGRAEGMASYMRTDTQHGTTEIGCIGHGTRFAGSTAATEAHYLMAKRVFDELGYRRYEWKLDDRNAPSHRAARRFGFTFEGVFRQHRVVPSGNRDTAWYAMLDSEWPVASEALRKWLAPTNFDAAGKQRQRLEDLREPYSPSPTTT